MQPDRKTQNSAQKGMESWGINKLYNCPMHNLPDYDYFPQIDVNTEKKQEKNTKASLLTRHMLFLWYEDKPSVAVVI